MFEFNRKLATAGAPSARLAATTPAARIVRERARGTEVARPRAAATAPNEGLGIALAVGTASVLAWVALTVLLARALEAPVLF